MFIREKYNSIPTLNDLNNYINNPLWEEFFNYIIDTYKAKYIFEFSKCSWEYGWNLKFKKSNKTICTIYPRENYFLTLIVISKKEKELISSIYNSLSPNVKIILKNTPEANNQRWLIIELEDNDETYRDVKKLIDLRFN